MRGELEAEQNCNILTSTLMTITAFLSRSHGLLNRGPSLSGCWFSLLHLISNWLDFLSSPGLYNCWPSTFLWASQITFNSTRPRSRLYPDIPRPDAPVIYTDAFPILTACPGSICYISIHKYKVSLIPPTFQIISKYRRDIRRSMEVSKGRIL